MTFDDILEQVVALLKRQRRVSYGAIKRRFELDDDYLEDLKGEILYVHPVIDDEGRGLIWTGDTEDILVTTPSPPDPPEPQSTAQEEPPTQVVSSPPESHTPEAERRQLTILFTDLVDSTKLSGQLDAEDYREVVRVYQAACAEVIQRFECHIAQTLGDGLLIYSGYPVAHENDAERAVRVSLGILEAMTVLNERLKHEKGIRLGVRVGIHTGTVVVGDVGAGSRQEQLAMGEVPNIAARLQGLADPDTVVISASTYRLIEGYFDCESLGERDLRGVAEPVVVYQVSRESGVQNRLDIASARGLTPLVGRESEVTLLFERWEQAKDGQGQIVLLSGEAGIGKSRLVQVIREHLADQPHTRWECRSSPYYRNTMLYPITDLLQRMLQFQSDDTPETKLGKLEHLLNPYRLPLEESVQLFAPLVSVAVPKERYLPLNWTPQRQRQKTLEALLSVLLEMAEQQPVLFILEDLHWTDPTTLEFLSLLVEQVPTAAIDVLLTCRPHFQPAWHHRSYLTEITVNRLSRIQIEQLSQHVAGEKRLPEIVRQQLFEKTDGVPLFVEEVTKALIESEYLQEMDGHYELTGALSSFAIPATLQDSLMARLDRLVTAKAVAQYASVFGRQVAYELLQAVSQLDDAALQRELRRLVEAELLYQRGLPPQATYTFKHALIQDVAYQSLLKSTRQQYHQRIAHVLEERFAGTAQTPYELLAHHYMEAGLIEQAVGYWQRAGEDAIQRSAYQEASTHLGKGLDGLNTLAKSPKRDKDELTFLMALVIALQATKGLASAEVEQALNRANRLCQQVGDVSQQVKILLGLRTLRHLQGELETAWQIGQQLLRLMDQIDAPELEVQVRYALGHTSHYLGAFDTARFHLERGVALSNLMPKRSSIVQIGLADMLGACYPPLAWSNWYAGYPDQSLKCAQEGLGLIQQNLDITGIEYLLSSAAIVYQLCGKKELAQEHIDRAIAIAMEQGFQFRLAWNLVLKGWIVGEQGRLPEGMDLISQGLDGYRRSGTQVSTPWFLALLADMHGRVGQVDQGLVIMTEAMILASEVGRCCYTAELHRLRGELLRLQLSDHNAESEVCFQQALDISKSQQAKSLELRAATSLAKLWQSQGKRQDAYDLLTPVYGWFTEGFDTADLIDANALLDDLEGR